MVTFSCKEREQLEIKWTVPVEKFISLLTKHFRVVRYYGALATRTKPLLKEILNKLFIINVLEWNKIFAFIYGNIQ